MITDQAFHFGCGTSSPVGTGLHQLRPHPRGQEAGQLALAAASAQMG